MQYTVPPDGSGVSAIATIALNKSSEIALFELVAEKAKNTVNERWSVCTVGGCNDYTVRRICT
ncbi:hypothetical protein KUL10_16330 [Glaciecola sp. KUL10]|nr:hypothetical protein KUL10_16330 [Glaciecola sp. KUL10]